MKAALKVGSDFGRVLLALRNVADRVPANARKTLRRTADRIVKVAKDYVPEDTSALMNSIRAEYTYADRGRLQVSIVVGGQAEVLVRGRLVNLDQYATIIHEHYEDMLVYGPGERTEEKMARFPGKVGSKFLTRAYEENRALLDRDLITTPQDIIRQEGLA